MSGIWLQGGRHRAYILLNTSSCLHITQMTSLGLPLLMPYLQVSYRYQAHCTARTPLYSQQPYVQLNPTQSHKLQSQVPKYRYQAHCTARTSLYSRKSHVQLEISCTALTESRPTNCNAKSQPCFAATLPLNSHKPNVQSQTQVTVTDSVQSHRAFTQSQTHSQSVTHCTVTDYYTVTDSLYSRTLICSHKLIAQLLAYL